MTKEHFIALADCIKANQPYAFFTERQLSDLADFCQAQNPQFKRECWLTYIAGECVPNGGKL